MIYLKARIKSLLTQKSRRRSLHSELKVLMANIMASNIAIIEQIKPLKSSTYIILMATCHIQ